jgi:hypothetical protein
MFFFLVALLGGTITNRAFSIINAEWGNRGVFSIIENTRFVMFFAENIVSHPVLAQEGCAPVSTVKPTTLAWRMRVFSLLIS